ncbi:MAG TPA: glycosyltransferase, partial [Bryobacteraceae bacterium]|nr:glycosyltransferase [Bryobacteraceae bacterium]
MPATAVIPHWNRRDLLESLLASLREQTRPFEEIIVADNGSTDDSADFAERSGARVLRLERNLGFAAAVNRGIEASKSKWVAILNNDVTLDRAWL